MEAVKQITNLTRSVWDVVTDVIDTDRLQYTLSRFIAFPRSMFTDTHFNDGCYHRAWAERDGDGTYKICVYNTDSRKNWPSYPSTAKPDGVDRVTAVRLLHHWNKQQLSTPGTQKAPPVYFSPGTHYRRVAELCGISL